eukprot:7633042-Karenia_brevis.AAC.1
MAGDMSPLESEIEQAGDFVRSQSPILGESISVVMEGQVERIKQLLFTSQDMDGNMAVQIGKSIQCGPWSDEQKQALGVALAQRLRMSKPKHHMTNKMQILVEGFPHYWTADVMDLVKSPTTQLWVK